jgi:putative SOS response-associated peptidase YedK
VAICGRLTLRTPPKAAVQAFGLTEAPDLKPHYNIGPTQPVAIRLDPETGTGSLCFSAGA